ncbi:hypothetical protein [Desulfovibrio sp. SGI.169]|uniref:hypothetical protein n=1 Tax=Desulfovibrio sp. SGI.169 TaxID=3420561 RepID=UPI003D06A15C
MNSSRTIAQTLDASHRFSHENQHIRQHARFDPLLIELIQHYQKQRKKRLCQGDCANCHCGKDKRDRPGTA